MVFKGEKWVYLKQLFSAAPSVGGHSLSLCTHILANTFFYLFILHLHIVVRIFFNIRNGFLGFWSLGSPNDVRDPVHLSPVAILEVAPRVLACWAGRDKKLVTFRQAGDQQELQARLCP